MYCTCEKSVHVYSVKKNREVPGVLPPGLDYAVCTLPCRGLSLPADGTPRPSKVPLSALCFPVAWPHTHTHTHTLTHTLRSWALPDFELDLSGATCVCPRDCQDRPRLCPAPPSRQPGLPPWSLVPHHSPGPLSLWSSGEGDIAACEFPAAQF